MDSQVSTVCGATRPEGPDAFNSAPDELNWPRNVSFTRSGAIVIADTRNHRVVAVTRQGTATVAAGNSQHGHADGPAQHARFVFPSAVAETPGGELVVADMGSHCLRKVRSPCVRCTQRADNAVRYPEVAM